MAGTVVGRQDLTSRLVSLDEPAAPAHRSRRWTPARSPAGGWCSWRTAASSATCAPSPRLTPATDGDICVRVAAELDWYRWAWSGQCPHAGGPVHLLWVE